MTEQRCCIFLFHSLVVYMKISVSCVVKNPRPSRFHFPLRSPSVRVLQVTRSGFSPLKIMSLKTSKAFPISSMYKTGVSHSIRLVPFQNYIICKANASVSARVSYIATLKLKKLDLSDFVTFEQLFTISFLNVARGSCILKTIISRK
jgi:hypothetical protein